jgi:hypothetical protein
MNERTRLIIESVLACTIMIGGIIWFACYKMYICDYMHWQLQLNRFPIYGHCFLLFGIPFFIGLVFYSSWKMVRSILRHKMINGRKGKKT